MVNYFKISKFVLYLIPLTIAVVTPSTLFPFIVGKYVLFRVLTGFAVIAFLLGLMFSKESQHYWQRLLKVVKSPLAIAVTIFVIAFLLAVVFGVDPSYSFWSNFERGEGGFQILSLYVFFLLLSVLLQNKKDWRALCWIIMLAAFLMVFYGVGASLKYIDADMGTQIKNGKEVQVLLGTGGFWYETFQRFIGGSFSRQGFRFSGSIGNPAYVAAYLVFVMFFAAYLLFSAGKSWKSRYSISILGLMLFFGIFFFLAATRGAFIGVGAGAFVAFGYLIYANKPWRKPLLITAFLLVLLVGSGFYFRDNPTFKKIPGSRVFDISFGAETLQDRLIMWGIAWKGFKDRPIFGWGPENYPQVFYKYYNPAVYNPVEGRGFPAWFDRAHNVVFDYLAETGAVGAVSYLGIYTTLLFQFFRATRRKDEEVTDENMERRGYSRESDDNKKENVSKARSVLIDALFVALPVAYFVQGLVLFEVFPLYLSLFTFLAFANFRFHLKNTD